MAKELSRFEINCETGEQYLVPYTAEELEQRAKDINANLARAIEEKATADARAALLERLGITEEEAILLLK